MQVSQMSDTLLGAVPSFDKVHRVNEAVRLDCVFKQTFNSKLGKARMDSRTSFATSWSTER